MASLKLNPAKYNGEPHPVETRGLVKVPQDYSQANGPELDVFYRLIPAAGTKLLDPSKPVVVVINGGPGLASKAYREYDYDYGKSPEDTLHPLTKHFHVLIMDQRGTTGLGSSIKMDDEDLDYKSVAKLFSGDSIARDQEAVINACLPPEVLFFIIAQSFGGIVGTQYLIQDAIKRKPKGLIFTSSAMPFENSFENAKERRTEQKKLNLSLKSTFPDFPNLARKLKSHLQSVGLAPELFHSLWYMLGKGNNGEWQKNLIDKIQEWITSDKAGIEKTLDSFLGQPDLLNFILSSPNMTPRETDLSIAKKVCDAIPFADWMFDEYLMFHLEGQKDTRDAKVMRRMDADPPEPIHFDDIQTTKQKMNKIPLLFTFGENDAMVPAEPAKEHINRNFVIPGNTEFATIEGGHRAAFTAAGAKIIADWIQKHR